MNTAGFIGDQASNDSSTFQASGRIRYSRKINSDGARKHQIRTALRVDFLAMKLARGVAAGSEMATVMERSAGLRRSRPCEKLLRRSSPIFSLWPLIPPSLAWR